MNELNDELTLEEARWWFDKSNVIAIVGLSSNITRDSNYTARKLLEAGFTIVPVNPKSDNILGLETFKSLEEIPFPVDIVNVFRPAKEVPDIVRSAIKIGARGVWVQLGITSPEAKKIAREHGIKYVENKCIKTEYRKWKDLLENNPGEKVEIPL